MLSEIQNRFASGLLRPDLPVPQGLRGPGDEVPQRRYNVYRNNVTVSLIEALASTYKEVQRLVGPEFFQAMAREFVTAKPPRSPVLILYGEEFADFIESFPPTDSVPYLADVARIEWAWLTAYHAADAKLADLSILHSVPPDRLEQIRFTLHPSVSLLRSRWPAVSIWSDRPESESDPTLDMEKGQDALIARPYADVNVRILPPGAFRFIESLSQGATLGKAAAATMAEAVEFDLSSHLTGLFEAGAVATIKLPPGQRDTSESVAEPFP